VRLRGFQRVAIFLFRDAAVVVGVEKSKREVRLPRALRPRRRELRERADEAPKTHGAHAFGVEERLDALKGRRFVAAAGE
jgi:hypothetical protein